MTVQNKPGEAPEVIPPVPTPEFNEDGSPKTPVEVNKGAEDIDFKKELENLEAGGTPPATPPKPARTELEKAEFTAKSTLKRIKELGGDPAKLIAEELPSPTPSVAPAPEVLVADEEKATKLADARVKAKTLAKSDAEINVIMWWVENKGMSVEDAHYMANKKKVATVAKEVARAETTVPSNGGGGAGQRPPEIKTNKMNEKNEQRLALAGMTYDQPTNSYVGKKTRVRHNGTTWVSERIVNGVWKLIPDASQFDQ